MTIAQKPEWLKIRPSSGTDFSRIRRVLRSKGLYTVCEEANCPNMAECWHNEGTATFMVMGDTCTRGCKFCAVKTARKGRTLDPEEPRKIADAVAEIGLDYVVITSVDRDDLPDGGAFHFARCIRYLKQKSPSTRIEVLIPDFAGDVAALRRIIDAGPDVIAHNVETIERLQKSVRDPRAGYQQSMKVLRDIKERSDIYSKSAIMVGLGEKEEEVVKTMEELRKNHCDILTIGQYLKPKNKFLRVEEYVTPETFDYYKKKAEELGFLYAASGPLVRSSYRAGELFMKSLLEVE